MSMTKLADERIQERYTESIYDQNWRDKQDGGCGVTVQLKDVAKKNGGQRREQ